MVPNNKYVTTQGQLNVPGIISVCSQCFFDSHVSCQIVYYAYLSFKHGWWRAQTSPWYRQYKSEWCC